MKRYLRIMAAFVLSAAILAASAISVAAFNPASDDALVAHFGFDGDLGTATATGAKASESGGSITFADGKVGQGAVLDGTSGIFLGENLVTGDKYSVAIWVNPSAITQFTPAVLVGTKDNIDTWMSLVPAGWDASKTMIWAHNTNDGEVWFDGVETKGASIAANTWSHLAYTVDGATATLYINGEEVFKGENLTDLFTGFDTLAYIGVNYWDTPYNGMVDEAYIYNKALSADEITSVMNATAAQIPDEDDVDDTDDEPTTPPTGVVIPMMAALPAMAAAAALISKKRK